MFTLCDYGLVQKLKRCYQITICLQYRANICIHENKIRGVMCLKQMLGICNMNWISLRNGNNTVHNHVTNIRIESQISDIQQQLFTFDIKRVQ